MAIAFDKGVRKSFDASLLDKLSPGDYILCHGDMAIQVLEKDDAIETIDALNSLELGYE